VADVKRFEGNAHGLPMVAQKCKIRKKGELPYCSRPYTPLEPVADGIRNYLSTDISKQLFAGKTDEEKQQLYSSLEQKIQGRVDHHQKHLGMLTSAATKGTGIGAIVNDAYHFLKGTPFGDFGLFQAALVGGKAALELPSLYSYLSETWDVYGAADWLGSKAIAWLIPVICLSLDYNVMTRITSKKAISEGVTEFLKEQGLYKAKKPMSRRVLDRVKRIAGDYLPAQPYARTPATAFA